MTAADWRHIQHPIIPAADRTSCLAQAPQRDFVHSDISLPAPVSALFRARLLIPGSI
nr:hypothetical protein [Escherichia coli]